jgi:ribonuclease HII
VQCVIKGDQKYAQIAAASILAKTFRDAVMRELSVIYPEYGFDHNFGYSTPEHFRALEKHGPCPLHRRSFAPIRELSQLCLEI